MSAPGPKSPARVFLRKAPRRVIDGAADFFRLEAAGGILLVLAAALALIIANSPFWATYDRVLNDVHILGLSPLHWINDALMAVFFLLVGLEIKREVMTGELTGLSKAALPIMAAIGGMVLPAVIFAAVNLDAPENLRGWAIPCATDIAFALGVLSLLGNRVPVSLKILLTAVAIIDDLGAILIIALFYTDDLNPLMLLLALAPLAGLWMLNRFGVSRRIPYLILGIILWALVLQSGVHATMAGVLTAFFIPLKVSNLKERRSPAQRLEHDLHPWTAFLILPIFAFANAGVPLGGTGLSDLGDPLPLGIIIGLVAGKQIGVFAALWLAVKSGYCRKPDGAGWAQLYGVSILCGIGFTMSLFIGALAFADEAQQAAVRLGVLAGSLISAVAAYILLKLTTKDVRIS